MRIVMDDKAFMKDMKNIVNYSVGYLEGIQKGKTAFFHSVGVETIEMLKKYIDTNARVNPEMMHHVYEWNRVGSPDARLFDLSYTVSNLGLSIKSTFRQSQSVQDGSNVPFYDKARIMENGVPVKIAPKRAQALSFLDENGNRVFTKNEVSVDNPGGLGVSGSFENTLDSFFSRYFTQAFLRSSGIAKYLEKQELYKKNLSLGKRSGKMAGIATGYRWIANAGLVA